MADMITKSTMKEFTTNDQKDYYLGITCIMVNGKNAYELKEKFLDDLHNNAFDRTNREAAVKHIEYFLRIVDPINLPNVNHDKLRVVVFLISLVGGARRWFDKIKESIDSWVDLTAKLFGKYYPLSRTGKTNTQMIRWDPTNLMFENDVPWVDEKPWTDTGVWTEPTPVKHYCKPFNYKTGCSEWPTCSWKNDGYCNGGNLPGAYIVGNLLHYQDYEWYEALKDSKLKEQALRNKAIMEGLISDDESCNDESCNDGWIRWESHEITYHDHDEIEYENETHDERQELCETHELPVYNMRRFEMIKYSFRQDEEYVAVKEDKYDDLARTSDDAC
ncbi:hypothetical protein Tco_1275549 [Tanacetum coccineum]